MKILIVLPNWLGDALMATPAIELLAKKYPDSKFTFVGSKVSIEALKYHPKCKNYYIDTTKQEKNRLKATLEFAKTLGYHDISITFRNQIHSNLLIRQTKSKLTLARSSWHAKLLGIKYTPKLDRDEHLVLQYAKLAMQNNNLDENDVPPLKLYIPPKKTDKKLLGINPGATYGSAKRWYPDRFAKVAAYFSNEYDIVIFGGPNEIQIANDIEKELLNIGVSNYTNLAGKTTIKELCEHIGNCSLFITNDSGPMHIAAAYQVPTVSIFGPTRYFETSQWKNHKSLILRKELKCSPCMKRECPLKHHDCMKKIEAIDVIEAIKLLKT